MDTKKGSDYRKKIKRLKDLCIECTNQINDIYKNESHKLNGKSDVSIEFIAKNGRIELN